MKNKTLRFFMLLMR